MIRTIDIHTGHTPFDTDVTMIDHPVDGRVVLRVIIGGATVNIFGSLDRLAEIRRAAVMLREAFGETEVEAIREAAE